MRIGLVTNWETKCAVAEYARNLVEHVQKANRRLEFKIISPPMSFQRVWTETRDCDVIHFNYAMHIFRDMELDGWGKFRNEKQKVIMTLHESSDFLVRNILREKIVDEMILHDAPRDGMGIPEEVRVIPFGVRHVDLSGIKVRPRSVATFGCAFPWKGLHELAYACDSLNMALTILMSEPDSEKGKINWDKLYAELRALNPTVTFIKAWLPEDQAIRMLASYACIAFPFDERAPVTGISASVRFGISARRPLILRKIVHFSDLYPKVNNIGWVEHGHDLRGMLEWGCDETWLTKPYQLYAYDEMSWDNSALSYLEAYGAQVGKSLIAR